MSKKNSTPAKEETRLTRAELRQSSAVATVTDLPVGFVDSGSFQLPEGAVIKSMSPLIRPIDFPTGKLLVGRFTKIFETNPGKDDDGKPKKGVGIEIVPEGAQMGVALPAVATLAQGLEIDDVKKGKDANSPYLGRIVAIQKMPQRLKSRKGQDAWHFVVAIWPENAKV